MVMTKMLLNVISCNVHVVVLQSIFKVSDMSVKGFLKHTSVDCNLYLPLL